MTSLQNLTVAQLRQIVKIKEKIQKLEKRLASIGGTSARAVGRPAKAGRKIRRRRKMSAATKKKLAAVARRRWAKVKASGKSTL